MGVTRIEIHYTGLATRLCFDGHFDNFTPQDKIQVSYDLPAAGQAGPDYSFSESYFPSSGYDIDAPDAPGTALTPLKVVTYFYDDNEIIGRFAFDSGNLNEGGMEPPVDENGDKIDGPVYLTPGLNSPSLTRVSHSWRSNSPSGAISVQEVRRICKFHMKTQKYKP